MEVGPVVVMVCAAAAMGGEGGAEFGGGAVVEDAAAGEAEVDVSVRDEDVGCCYPFGGEDGEGGEGCCWVGG